MIKNLSSRQTFIVKFITPAMIVSLLVFVVARGLTAGRGSHWNLMAMFSSPMGWLFLISLGVAGYIVWWSLARLKYVRMDEQSLFISDYFNEIKVPLVEVEDVSESLWSKTHPVTIRFKSNTEFGLEIVFVPKMRLFRFGGSHPVVDEIWEAVGQAKRRGESGRLLRV